jgi:uncharacterized membrane protein YdbT with pleckstrin-like domain
MSYVDSSLVPGEQVIHRARLHWTIYLRGALMACAGLLFFPFLFVGLAMVASAAVRQRSTEMAVTNKRIIMKTGVLSTKTLELNLAKIETVGVDQTFLGSMLDYGTITVVGTGGTREKFNGVFAPIVLRRAVQHASEGVHRLAA